MKSVFSIILSVLLLFMLMPLCVFSDNEISVYLNGNLVTFDQPPVVVNDRTLIPLRAVSEKMGFDVKWDNGIVTVSGAGRHAVLTIGNDKAFLDGVEISLDVPAQIVNDRTLVPLRFIGESMGADVKWEEHTHSVYITYDDSIVYFSLSDITNSDVLVPFSYNEFYFTNSSYAYNHSLALISLGMAVSAFSTSASNSSYGENGDIGREDNLKKSYDAMGFTDARFYNYDKSLNDTSDKVAYGIARKTLSDGSTLVSVALRGGGYGAEWASNFNVGAAGNEHNGFSAAKNEVYSSLSDYINGIALSSLKIWITGYSRGGAVANLLAASLDNGKLCSPSNVFTYTFGSPYTKIISEDYDKTKNIFNIINPRDIVPLIPIDSWGIARCGVTLALPSASDTYEYRQLCKKVGGTYHSFTGLSYDPLCGDAQISYAYNEMKSLVNVFYDREIYARVWQPLFIDIMGFKFSCYKNADGKYVPYETLSDYLVAVYGEKGTDAWSKANEFVKTIGSSITSVSSENNMDRSSVEEYFIDLLALCFLNGVSPLSLMSVLSSPKAVDNLFIIFKSGIFTTADIAQNHSPAVYFAWLENISDVKSMNILR
ncbi:MAG: stalk domain-containing protein [Bacillota bacterium]|nr:stalk domain-containing protein [Bacillota bacterium]